MKKRATASGGVETSASAPAAASCPDKGLKPEDLSVYRILGARHKLVEHRFHFGEPPLGRISPRSDPDALAAEFASRHVEFFRPLNDDDGEDGLRGFEVKDADGYLLFFGRRSWGRHKAKGIRPKGWDDRSEILASCPARLQSLLPVRLPWCSATSRRRA